MSPPYTTRTPGDLEEFVHEVFASLPRKDQRTTCGYYLQGLMLEGRRKSMQPMAARLGIDHQRLQQFVTSSPWEVEPVRTVLAHKAVELIEPEAWVVDDTGFVKDGHASPGVARQYSGTLGKVGNVQIGVSVHAVTDVASCPLNWRLFLPRNWDESYAETEEERRQVRQRRAGARIPDEVGHRPKADLALEMIDELTGWNLTPPVVVADAGYGESGLFRTALSERNLPYIVQVKAVTSLHPADAVYEAPAYSGAGRPRKPGYQIPPVQAQEIAQSLPQSSYRQVAWRRGSKSTLRSRFAAERVRPANRNIPRNPDGTLPAVWLLIEWPGGAAAPTDYWLSSLPEDTPIEQLVRLGKMRWRIEHDYREMKHGLGLDHFEGRSWLGWHHHTVLVAAAHLFVTLRWLSTNPKVPPAV